LLRDIHFHVLRLHTPADAEDGVPGQGNNDPISLFTNHGLVTFGTSIYDPSYGGGPFGSLVEWQRASLDGVSFRYVAISGALQIINS
jgi:hypothetical protein